MYCELVEVRVFQDARRRGVMVLPQPSQFVYGDPNQQGAWALKVRRDEDGRRVGFLVPIADLPDAELRRLKHVLIEHFCRRAMLARAEADRRRFDQKLGIGEVKVEELVGVEESDPPRRRRRRS